MAKHLYVLLTNPVEGREDEFNDWYDNQHLDDLLRIPGIVAAQRFRLSVTDPPQKAGHRYLAIYEIEADDVNAVNAAILAAAGTAGMPISEALDLTTLGTYYFEPIGERRAAP